MSTFVTRFLKIDCIYECIRISICWLLGINK